MISYSHYVRSLNLDDEKSLYEFRENYLFTRKEGAELAEALGIAGLGCIKIANLLWRFAFNKKIAFDLRKEGNIEHAENFEQYCTKIYNELPEELRWRKNNKLPNPYRNSITLSLFSHMSAINGNLLSNSNIKQITDEWIEEGAKEIGIVVCDKNLNVHKIKFERKN